MWSPIDTVAAVACCCSHQRGHLLLTVADIFDNIALCCVPIVSCCTLLSPYVATESNNMGDLQWVNQVNMGQHGLMLRLRFLLMAFLRRATRLYPEPNVHICSVYPQDLPPSFGVPEPSIVPTAFVSRSAPTLSKPSHRSSTTSRRFASRAKGPTRSLRLTVAVNPHPMS
jgi:hypothetical protein